jgi:hypothetical protein
MKDAVAAVLSAADIICTTLTNTSHKVLKTNSKADVVFVDKPARALEVDVLSPLVINKPQMTTLIGDDRQLLPTVISNAKDCMSALQLAPSLFQRLKKLNVDSSLFIRQHRMTPQVAMYIHRFVYQNVVKNDGTTELLQRPKATQFSNFLKGELDTEGSVAFVDVPDSEMVVRQDTKSRYNVGMAQVTLDLIDR